MFFPWVRHFHTGYKVFEYIYIYETVPWATWWTFVNLKTTTEFLRRTGFWIFLVHAKRGTGVSRICGISPELTVFQFRIFPNFAVTCFSADHHGTFCRRFNIVPPLGRARFWTPSFTRVTGFSTTPVVAARAVLKEFFEGIIYHHKRNHKQLSRGVGVWGRSSWKICLAFKVP